MTLADALCAIDPDNKNTYIANAAAYKDKLAALDADYKAAVDGAAHKTVLFGDRFPFRYLVDDYGLRYYAAFAGCSAEGKKFFGTAPPTTLSANTRPSESHGSNSIHTSPN